MVDQELKTQLCRLYEETMSIKFQKKTYAAEMEKLMSSHRGLMERVAACIDTDADDMAELADVLPAYVAEKLDKEPSKRKRQMASLDCNMNMVSFILPFLGEVRSLSARDFTHKIVECWNKRMKQYPIGHSTYTDIQGGFKKGIFCFITSAVCRSMGKPDDCCELETFRRFRDEVLAATPEGRELIRTYYDIAPTIVKRIDKEKDHERIYAEIWEKYLKTCFRYAQDGQNEMCRQLYCEMVTALADQYVYKYVDMDAQEGYA